MVAQEHIKDVGPHPHQWVLAHAVGGQKYEVCDVCGTRQVTGQGPVNQVWLDGGPWEGGQQGEAAPSEDGDQAAAENDDEPTDSQIRHMRKDELVALADRHGIDHSDDPTNADLAERIIEERA